MRLPMRGKLQANSSRLERGTEERLAAVLIVVKLWLWHILPPVHEFGGPINLMPLSLDCASTKKFFPTHITAKILYIHGHISRLPFLDFDGG